MNDNGTNGTLASNREVMSRFLDKLRDSGNVRLACRAAGVPRRTVYNWRDRWVTFADEWDDALDDACDRLEEKAWERALDYSDRLLQFLLKAHRPGRYNPPQQHQVESDNTVRVLYVNDWRNSSTEPA